ncbi:MAG: HPF/RaiA family ribosome-associated protein [Rhodocyclaceae bacterium]|nr:HPF/RaiA family ribosome-associated protein [Rhodocyclaceae bacterium]
MELDIQARDFTLTAALRRHVERRVLFALSRYRDRISSVDVRLRDDNGPRGGVDKCCRVHLRLGGMPDIVVEDREEDLYLAVSRSASRAGLALGRQLGRIRGILASRRRVAQLLVPE